LIENHGPDILGDWERCQAWLRYACPEHKREVNVLLAALKEGVPQELMASGNEEAATQRLTNDLALSEEAARWAAEAWRRALSAPIRPVGVGAPTRCAAPGGAAPDPAAAFAKDHEQPAPPARPCRHPADKPFCPAGEAEAPERRKRLLQLLDTLVTG